MRLSKRVLVAVVCLIVVAICVAVPASASGNITLQPPPGGDEPGASGHATVHVTSWGGPWIGGPEGTVSFSCRGLTPGERYSVWTNCGFAGPDSTVASANGRLAVKGGWLAFNAANLPAYVAVSRVVPGGSVTVLAGTVVWK